MSFTCANCSADSGTSLVCRECIPILTTYQREKFMRTWHKIVVERDGCQCTYCGHSAPFDSGELCGDHIETRGSRPDLAFDVSNGRATCMTCHTHRHAGHLSPHKTMRENRKAQEEKKEKAPKRKECKCRPRCPLIPLDNGYCIQSQHLARKKLG